MKNKIVLLIGRKTIRYINYLRKKGIKYLQDDDGNIIDISIEKPKEKLNCWLNQPVEIEINGEKGLYYKNKIYVLNK